MGEIVWEGKVGIQEFSTLSVQVFCKLKAAPKIKTINLKKVASPPNSFLDAEFFGEHHDYLRWDLERQHPALESWELQEEVGSESH